VQQRKAGGGLSFSVSQLVNNSRANMLLMSHDEQLSHYTAAVAGNNIDFQDRETSEQCREHRDLRIGRDALAVGNLRITQRHKIGSDATTVRRQALQRATPLKAVERKTVKEECASPLPRST
jgi:hypothetical protein